MDKQREVIEALALALSLFIEIPDDQLYPEDNDNFLKGIHELQRIMYSSITYEADINRIQCICSGEYKKCNCGRFDDMV